MPPSSTNNFFGIKVSKTGIPVQNASDKQLIYKDNFTTKTYFDQTNPRMVEGLLPDGTYGLWVSKPGTDVTDPNAVANNNLIFNSNQDIFKISKKITTTIPSFSIGSGQVNFVLKSFAHGLPITPIVNIYVAGQLLNFGNSSLVASSYVPLPVTNSGGANTYFFPAASGASYGLTIIFAVDSTNVYIQASSSFNSTPTDTISAIPATCFLLQETAT